MVSFVTCGPSGGMGGSTFTDGLKGDLEVAEVKVRSKDYIDAIQIIYGDKAGDTSVSDQHGGTGGSPSNFRLEPEEYITEVGGKYGYYIDSLWIKTNQGRTKNWGGSGGEVSFKYIAPPETRIVGFFGQAGDFLDSIGVIMRTP